jgi:tetratricopeptide (TPR) repeat protein
MGEGLSNLGIGTLSRSERVGVFERLQLPMSSALTRATMIRVGELIGASEIVFGEVRLGQTLDVRVRTIRLGTGQERPVITDSASLAEMVPLFKRVAGRVADATDRRARPATADSIPALPLEAFESYVKGLVAATPPAQQRFLEDARRLAPNDPRILLALWEAYTAQDMHDRALASANAVAADSTWASQARFAVALSLISLKRLDGAFQELTALAKRSSAAAVSNALGVVQLRRGELSGTSPAATYFRRAVDTEPDNTTFLFNLGYAHALTPNAADALTWLREAVRFNAADGDAHLVMSAVLSGAGRSAEAQRELELAKSLGTSLESAAATLTARVPPGLERLTTDLNPSVSPRPTAVTPAQRDQQETAAFHLTRARTLVEQRKDREAIEELRRAIYLSPYQDEPHLLLGQAYHRAGQLAEAIDEFKVALWSRETAAAHIALGAALLDAGETEAARQAATRALSLAPASVEARELLKRTGG